MWELLEVNDSISQLAFTCSKSTMETPEKYVKYVQSQQKRHKNDVTDVVLV